MNYKEKYRQWLTFADSDTKAELESLTDEKEIEVGSIRTWPLAPAACGALWAPGLTDEPLHRR